MSADQNGLEPTAALTLGNQVFIPAQFADGKPYVFTRQQIEFLVALQKLKSVHAAALAVNKEEGWAHSFINSKKFKSYVGGKMHEFSVKNGLTIEWWYQFGKWLAEGKKEFYEAPCQYCGENNVFNAYEIEGFRQDDMSLKAECATCYKPVLPQLKEIAFKPSREQVEGWKALGDRLIPKIERIHHQYEAVDIVFEAQE